MLWQGKSILPLEFQRAAGWWEAVPGMIQLALEQPPERRSFVSRSGRVLRRYQRSSIRRMGWYDRVGAVAPMRMVPRKLRFRFLITGNESVFCYSHRSQSYHYWKTKYSGNRERKADSNEKCKQIPQRVFSPPHLPDEMDTERLYRQSPCLVQCRPSGW